MFPYFFCVDEVIFAKILVMECKSGLEFCFFKFSINYMVMLVKKKK